MTSWNNPPICSAVEQGTDFGVDHFKIGTQPSRNSTTGMGTLWPKPAASPSPPTWPPLLRLLLPGMERDVDGLGTMGHAWPWLVWDSLLRGGLKGKPHHFGGPHFSDTVACKGRCKEKADPL